MNLYLAVSEGLDDVRDYVVEPYSIAELVVARNRGQAKWLAWKSDYRSFNGDVRDMPKFRVPLKRREVEGPARIVSHDKEYDDDLLWAFNDEPIEEEQDEPAT